MAKAKHFGPGGRSKLAPHNGGKPLDDVGRRQRAADLKRAKDKAARAQEDRDEKPTQPARRHTAPSEHPMAKGSADRPGGTDLKTTIHAFTPSEYEQGQLGAISYGIISEVTAPLKLETADVLPPWALPPKPGQQNTAPQHFEEQARWLAKYREEIAIGRELVRSGAFGKVLIAMGINAAAGAQHYAQAIRRAQLSAGVPGLQMQGTGSGGLLPPLDVPTSVTSAFAVIRRGADGAVKDVHKGVDLGCPVGSAVHAPAPAKVLSVWTEDEGGQCMKLGLQRPDGGYARDEYVAGVGTVRDDTGITVTFVHLTPGSCVEKGTIVGAGDVVARSGNSGTDTTGPHLHVMTELFQDAAVYSFDSNSLVMLDPVEVWGGRDAITGASEPVMHHAGEVIDGLLVPRSGGAAAPSAGPIDQLMSMAGMTPAQDGGGTVKPLSLVINNSGSLVMGNGTAVNANLRVLFPLSELGSGGGAGDGGFGDPSSGQQRAPLQVPKELSGIVQQAMSLGGVITQKGGTILATFLNPNNVAVVVKLGAGAVGLAGTLAGLAGPVATLVAPAAVAIPYVGPVIATALEVGGPIASVLGPVVAGMAGVGGSILGNSNVMGGITGAVQGILAKLNGGAGGGLPPLDDAAATALSLGGPAGLMGQLFGQPTA